MKDFIILKILDRFKFIFNKMKINYLVMRKILQIKFITDGRRVPTAHGINNNNKHENKNFFIKSLWIYAFIGAIVIVPIVLFFNNFFYQMSIIFGVILFLITYEVISDFSSVLLDIRDKTIIGSKPVDSRTISAAKFIHIVTYLFMVTLALILPGLIAIFIKNWVLNGIIYSLLFLLLYVIELILVDLFIVVLTTLLYLFILRFYDGEKLKDIINYVQIITSITIAVSYQLVVREVNSLSITQIEFTPDWYHYLLIPLWFGAPFELFFNKNYDMSIIVFSSLVVIVPIIAFAIYIKLIPTFESSLLKLNQSQKKVKPKKKPFINKIITKNSEERLFYQFALQMMKSERAFKLRVYPLLGFSLIFPFIFLINSINEIDKIASTKLYFFIYLCGYLLPAVIIMLQYSSSYKGAWIYKVTPIKNIGLLGKGALKAFITRLVLPIYLLESAVFIILFGFHIIPDLIIIFISLLAFSVICYKTIGFRIPFSESYDNYDKSQGMISIVLMFLLGIFALVHFLFTLFNYGIYIYFVSILLINYVLWKYSFNFTKKV